GIVKNGDITIGGIFPVKIMDFATENLFTEKPEPQSCGKFLLQPFLWVQIMIFAIEEINQNQNLLPNITLGYGIYDSYYRCSSSNPLAAIIGEASDKMTIAIATLLRVHNYPQISHATTVDFLSDRQQFPSFFRTIPNGNYRSRSLVKLMQYFGWNWVGTVAEDNEIGELATQDLIQELDKTEICIGFSETIPNVYSAIKIRHVVEVIRRSSVNAIVIISYELFIVPLIAEVTRQNITGKVWVSTEAWSTSASFYKGSQARTVTGTIGVAVHKGDIPGFKEFLLRLNPFTSQDNIYIKNFWEHMFGGSEKLNELNVSFFDASESRITYNVYNGIYAIAHALHDLYMCIPGEGPFENGTCANIHYFEPWQLLHYVKNVHFTNKLGEEIYFDGNGNPPPLYDIINWHRVPDGNLKNVEVGRFNFSAPHGKDFIINNSALMWNGGNTQIPHSICSESCPPGYRKAARRGQPICCFDCILCSEGEITNQTDSIDCLKCPSDHWSSNGRDKCIPKTIEFLSYQEPLGATLASVSILFSLIPAAILCTFVKHRDTPIVKANNRELSYLLLLALMLCFLCSLIFIGQPKISTCMLRQVAFGIIFALCVSCVLAKTIMVVIAFNATKPNSKLKKWVGPKLPNAVVFVCTVIQVIICIAWLSSSPPFPEQNMRSQIQKIIIECNDGSTTAFWLVLGYMGILAIVCFIVAFLARNLPDSFNEAKFITFSMLVFVTVWLSFIPAYLSTKGKYMVAVEIFAILASSTGLMACIFSPKCYIIILRPERNTREYLMGK
uniref:G-protein coupled receptors family 3 profile domain-containing protein n=1 Tax=Latimeria chalumnae TaxID=7897 RepID=H3A198_LATCH